jgi:hypothetical protein
VYVYAPAGSVGAGYSAEVSVATQVEEMCKRVNLNLRFPTSVWETGKLLLMGCRKSYCKQNKTTLSAVEVESTWQAASGQHWAGACAPAILGVRANASGSSGCLPLGC